MYNMSLYSYNCRNQQSPEIRTFELKEFVKSSWFEGKAGAKAGEGIRTLDFQLGKLTFYH